MNARTIYLNAYRLARVHPEIMFEDRSATDAFTQGIKSLFQREVIMDRYWAGHWMVQRECINTMAITAYWWRLTCQIEEVAL